MAASSVTGVSGQGSVASIPTQIKSLTDSLISVNQNLTSVNNNVCMVAKFNTSYYENYNAIMNHRLGDNGAVEFRGGGLFVVPGTSDRSCCDSCNGYYCDNWCCPCYCNCCCGFHHPWYLMAVNVEDMTEIAWSARWEWSEIDISPFTNLEYLWIENFTNGVMSIDGYDNLYEIGLKFGTVNNDITIANCSNLQQLTMRKMVAENISIDWDTCRNMYQIDFYSNDWDSDRVDNLLITFANSLVKYPRSGWYFAIQGGSNAAPTAAADEAIGIIEDNGWDIYYN